METMPVSVAINQFKQKIVDNINNSGLHISIVEMIFSDIYSDIKSLSKQTEKQEEEQYNKEEVHAESQN